jgi:hypothetical protein
MRLVVMFSLIFPALGWNLPRAPRDRSDQGKSNPSKNSPRLRQRSAGHD